MCDYREFQPKNSEHQKESIEWSIAYAFNAPDRESKRVLLIGDSICHAYGNDVRQCLADCVNVSYWASSKCVTDADYFRELDFYLDAYPYHMICLNNGLHSLATEKVAWTEAYEAVVSFIRARHPQAKLSLVLCTAMNSPKNEIVITLNGIITEIAQKYQLPIVDLYTPMQALDKDSNMRDAYHYLPPAVKTQAEVLAAHVKAQLGMDTGEIVQAGTITGPDGKLD